MGDGQRRKGVLVSTPPGRAVPWLWVSAGQASSNQGSSGNITRHNPGDFVGLQVQRPQAAHVLQRGHPGQQVRVQEQVGGGDEVVKLCLALVIVHAQQPARRRHRTQKHCQCLCMCRHMPWRGGSNTEQQQPRPSSASLRACTTVWHRRTLAGKARGASRFSMLDGGLHHSQRTTQ